MVKKQETDKHKASITRGVSRSRAGASVAKSDPSQVFDIVPRGRVRADATSRPVITGNKPEVNDNTLATAPLLGLKQHGTLSIAPLTPKSHMLDGDVATASADTSASGVTDATESEDAAEVNKLAALKEKGVSVTELLAKRTEEQDASVSGVDVGSTIDLSINPSKSSKPAVEVEAPGGNDKDGAPKDDTAENASPTSNSAAEDTSNAKTGSRLADGNIDNDEALAKALQDDPADKPQEHSEALKEEMKNLGEDGRPHYELYGGKPVIVVHKAHGTSSAAMWVLWLLVCVLLAVVIVDVLLDAGIVKTSYNVPFTDFIKE